MNSAVEERVNSMQGENTLVQGMWLSCSSEVYFELLFTNTYSARNTLALARSHLDAHSIDLFLQLLAFTFSD